MSSSPRKPGRFPRRRFSRDWLQMPLKRGVCGDDITSRDLFDTKLMGVLTPAPREVRKTFAELYAEKPEAATDWFYRFSQDTDYIRRYRIQKDMRWMTATDYGTLDITINLEQTGKESQSNCCRKVRSAIRISEVPALHGK